MELVGYVSDGKEIGDGHRELGIGATPLFSLDFLDLGLFLP